ncbi:hypothetical protein EV641_106217 [Rhodococcus sp. SMB37]|uniref:helix-turn-helix domain-containing protein n=1 Tax=Rhodococcus sp. SMB37 TaxID=2512213 RepID=UPI0010E3FF39|nr:helix-turn-helix domain-containing protein [Rhodococcus sp. SMB37]TCN53571.1 hypothetical protein EV641_106217 [Rhodococcus sp. SMB37]
MSTKAHADTTPRHRATDFSAALKEALAAVPDTERDSFVLGVVGDDTNGDGLDPALWGPPPTSADRKRAALENLRRQYRARRAVADASLTRTEAAELLEVSEQAILDRLKTGDLIGLKKSREWRLPAWQFHADTETGVVPGLSQVGAVFPGGAVSLTEWAQTPNSDLEGTTPADALATGRVEDVVRAAHAGTAAAW